MGRSSEPRRPSLIGAPTATANSAELPASPMPPTEHRSSSACPVGSAGGGSVVGLRGLLAASRRTRRRPDQSGTARFVLVTSPRVARARSRAAIDRPAGPCDRWRGPRQRCGPGRDTRGDENGERGTGADEPTGRRWATLRRLWGPAGVGEACHELVPPGDEGRLELGRQCRRRSSQPQPPVGGQADR